MNTTIIKTVLFTVVSLLLAILAFTLILTSAAKAEEEKALNTNNALLLTLLNNKECMMEMQLPNKEWSCKAANPALRKVISYAHFQVDRKYMVLNNVYVSTMPNNVTRVFMKEVAPLTFKVTEYEYQGKRVKVP